MVSHGKRTRGARRAPGAAPAAFVGPVLVAPSWGFPAPDQVTADVLRVLVRCYGWDVRGWLDNSWRVHVTHDTPGGLRTSFAEWYVHDNGGELGCCPVNGDRAAYPDVPVTIWGVPLDAGTLAYRLAMRGRGEPIDYGRTCPELIELAAEMDPGKREPWVIGGAS